MICMLRGKRTIIWDFPGSNPGRGTNWIYRHFISPASSDVTFDPPYILVWRVQCPEPDIKGHI
jgi:hypothetical protein